MTASCPQLDERHERFLATVVECHARSATPVGSRAVSRRPDVAISPASVRNVFAALEQAGLVMRPHASAGRVPTARGYRYYVDRLLTERSLSDADTEEVTALALASTRCAAVADELVRRFSPVVRQLTVALEVRGPGTTVAFSGARFMVEQPEFDRSALAPIFEILDERTALVRSLTRLARAGDAVDVQIGEEIGLRGVESCTLVGVATHRDPVRAVAILGPTRLDYPDVVSRLRLLRDALA